MSPPRSDEIQKRDLVEGLGKGLRVIESFDEDHVRQTVSEVAARADLTRAAARRMLLSLVHYGHAASDGKQYWLTPRVLRLGQSYLASARLPRLVQPFIQHISLQCGETVNVSVLDGHEVVYIARSNPPRFLSIGYQVGVRVPAHVVTPGVVILAAMPDAAAEQWINEHDFVGFTAATVTEVASFRAELREARAQDHWTAAGQLESGLRGIAVALRDRKARCVGALSMTVPASAYDRERAQRELLPLLRGGAQDLRPLL